MLLQTVLSPQGVGLLWNILLQAKRVIRYSDRTFQNDVGGHVIGEPPPTLPPPPSPQNKEEKKKKKKAEKKKRNSGERMTSRKEREKERKERMEGRKGGSVCV